MSLACTGASWKHTVVRMSSSSSSTSEQIFEPFFSKMEELITNYTHNIMKSIKVFKLNLERLHETLKLLNAKASNVEEQIKFLESSGQKKRKREIEDWLRQVKAIENEVVELGTRAAPEGFIKSMMDGGKVDLLNKEVLMLFEQSQRFDELLRDACGTRGVELLTTTMVGEAFDENLKKIWNLLETGEVSSICIHGMGGVGKTALAKCINNQLLKQSQVSVLWITVSQELTIKSLQEKMACFLGVNFLNENDEDIRAARLHKAFMRIKNSVLILDDLWENIDMLKLGCPVSVECCRLIITTRSLEVCRQTRCQKLIAVKTLCWAEAWELFIETLAPGEEIILSPPVEEAVKSMTRLCGGLPLGIITMAGRMRRLTSIHSWTAALAEVMESPTIQDGVYRTLKYSFDRLNYQSQCKEFNLFQRCFLYCSLYPRMPDNNELVERFISEGLVDVRKSRRAQVLQGHSILDKLVDVCLLEARRELDWVADLEADLEADWEADGQIGVTMHNLVRGMALKINEGKYMVRGDDDLSEIPNEGEWTKDLEKVLLMHNNITIIRDGTSPNCPKLSTLLLQDNPLTIIPDSFFSKMQRLSTLDLRSTSIRVLPEIVSDLTSLEALLLEYCEHLKKVPYLGKLKALKELNLSYTAIKEVPHGLEELISLKILSMEARNLKMLPTGLLGRLSHLQVVKFPTQVEIPAEEIVNLKEVEQLRGRLNNVCAFNCFIKSRKVVSQVQVHVQVGPVHNDEESRKVVGDYGRRVYLNMCDLENEKVLGEDIGVLTITECRGLSKCLLDAFSSSSYPKSLRWLRVEICEGIECILTSSLESSSQFSTLGGMELEELKDFKGLLIQKEEIGAAPAQSVFSSLHSLTIISCNKMRKLGLPVLGAPNLEYITIRKCGEIKEIFEDDVRGCVALPNLRQLNLDELPRLERLCNGKMICSSMIYICIYRCPRLKKLPLYFDVRLPRTLTLPCIRAEREWWESLEREENSNLHQFPKLHLYLF